MDPSQDNPFVRFKAFFWALAVFGLFGALLAVIALFNDKKPSSLEDVVAVDRYANRQKVEAAQDANFAYKSVEEGKVVQVPPADVFAHVGGMLSSAKPAAVERPEQVVPGSAAAAELEKKAATAAPVVVAENDANAPIDPAVMASGKASFLVCSACHGQNGEGGVIAPPLAGSEWVKGPVSNLIRIQLRGLKGPIKVARKDYNFAGGMAALSYQTDEQIAGVLTYIRNSFGNKASAVTAAQVAALRSEVGKPQLPTEELVKP